jgi:hypothetical protein
MKRLPPNPVTALMAGDMGAVQRALGFTPPGSAKALAKRDPRRAREFAVAITSKLAECELALRIDDSVNVTAVKDYAEASGIVEELREQHMEQGLGNSTFPRMTIVNLESCETVAHVSWNGKVWPGEQWTPDAKPLYEPGRGLPMIQSGN